MHRQKPFSDFCDPMESIRQGNNAALQASQKRPTSHKYSRDQRKDYAEDVHIRKTICSCFSSCISTRHHIHVYIYFMMLWLRFLPMMIRILKEEAMKVCLSVAGIVQNSQRMKLTMHNALIIGFPGGWPQGHPRGIPREQLGNSTSDNFLGARGEDIVWFWKQTLQTPGMHPRDLVAIALAKRIPRNS